VFGRSKAADSNATIDSADEKYATPDARIFPIACIRAESSESANVASEYEYPCPSHVHVEFHSILPLQDREFAIGSDPAPNDRESSVLSSRLAADSERVISPLNLQSAYRVSHVDARFLVVLACTPDVTTETTAHGNSTTSAPDFACVPCNLDVTKGVARKRELRVTPLTQSAHRGLMGARFLQDAVTPRPA